MFQPVYNNIGPALIEKGYARAGELTAQGTAVAGEAMAQGVSSAGQSIAGGITAGASKWMKDAEHEDANTGIAKAYQMMDESSKAKTGTGMLPDGFWDAYYKAKNPNERSGMLVTAGPVVESFLSTQRQLAVANATNNFTPTFQKVGGVGMVETSPGNWSQAGGRGGSGGKSVLGVSVDPGVKIYGGQGNGK